MPAEAMSAPTEATLEPDRAEIVGLVVRFVAALVIVSVAVALLGYFVREPAAALARGFVGRFGIWGMMLGTLMADGLHFPVPPQFYMLLAVASNTPAYLAFPAIALASILSGCLGYQLASWASRLGWLAKRTERYRAMLLQAYQRRGYRTALVASLLPIPYSVLCYLAGLNRLPAPFLVLVGLCRVPKLLGFYGLVYMGWSLI
jgi:membrane protein YqaA with SNARE-associated domain